jgi:anti-sigma factor RsiW
MIKSDNCEMEIKKIWEKCHITEGAHEKCPDIDILAAYLDHRLSDNKSEVVERHLLQCSSCLNAALIIREAIDRPKEDALTDQEVQQLFDLMPRSPGSWRQILERIAGLLASRVVPAPVFALSVFLMCGIGFYAGMQTRVEQDLFHNQIAAELNFFFDNPAMDHKFSGEEG